MRLRPLELRHFHLGFFRFQLLSKPEHFFLHAIERLE